MCVTVASQHICAARQHPRGARRISFLYSLDGIVDDVVNVVQQSFRHGRLIEIVRTFAFTGLEIIEYYFVESSIGEHDDHVAA